MGRKGVLAAWLCAILALLVATAAASDRPVSGRLDPSFAEKGWRATSPGAAGEEADVEVLASVGGAVVVADPLEGRIVRLRGDGSLDAGFARRGVLSLGLSTGSEGHPGHTLFLPEAVAVDKAGRVLVFGRQSFLGRSVFIGGTVGELPASEALILRFTPSGRLDPSFGSGRGFVRGGFGLVSPYSSDIPLVAAMVGSVDSRNRPLLIAGVAAPSYGCIGKGGPGTVPRAVVRLTSSGRLDRSFGSGGASPVEGTSHLPMLQLDNRGRLAVGVGPIGGSEPQCKAGDTIYRLGQNGERLSGFGSDGVLPLKRNEFAALEPSGSVLVSRRLPHALVLSRLLPNGARDLEFGSVGKAKIGLPRSPGLQVTSVQVDEKRRIVLAGFIESAGAEGHGGAFVVGRVLADGKLDRHFGQGGWTASKFPGSLEITSAAAELDAQGRLVVAGTAATPRNPDGGFVVARYRMDP